MTLPLLSAQDKELKGFGVIDRVIHAGPEPVIQADGYRIRLTADSQVSFHGNLKSIADVGMGTYVRFEGKRDDSGDVVAARAKFFSVKSGVKKPDPGQLRDNVPFKESLIDSKGNFMPLHEKVRMSDAGGWCGWHKVSADPSLQARVQRVGVSLVPMYQKQMAQEQAAKIHFRFYVVEEREIRSELVCSPGLILIPRPVLERLGNDDQLAAVLADGIAFSMQSIRAEEDALKGVLEVGEDAAWFVDPIAALAVAGTLGAVSYEINLRLEKERGRIALTLMTDAGYDPWQAPEAWRLLGPKHSS
ncbi:MAG: hypothetical protein WBF42_15255, partial [Terracidiphilus sp.]